MVQIVVVILLLIKVGFTAFHYIKNGIADKSKWQKYGKLLLWIILTVFVLFVMFLGYGKGNIELQSEKEPIGRTKMQLETPYENIDSVRKATEEKKPHTLKRQDDSGFEEEEKQAEDYLKKHGLN